MWLFYTFAGCAFLVYFSAHPVHLMYSLTAIIISLILWAVNRLYKLIKKNELKTYNPNSYHMIEFAKDIEQIDFHQYWMLSRYFHSSGISFENANKFLNSTKGMAFMSAYSKDKKPDFQKISKLIINIERDEHIVSCAVDILKTYRD